MTAALDIYPPAAPPVALRAYQQEAVDAIMAAFQEHDSTLAVMPTGCGKTIVFASVIHRFPTGRVMIVAHREELIWQGAAKVHEVTGQRPDIEMAAWAARGGMFDRARVVVSSVQTQIAGEGGDGRMTRFRPADFSLLIVDEAHHATAPTYRRVIDHYRTNPNLKVLGVTATPDRADEEALGQVFQSVAFDYELTDSIADGWLVPIRQRAVIVDALDYSHVRTTAGDLNGADLAGVLEYEAALHGIAGPTMELTAGRRTLVFAASVAHAERLCEIFNRHTPGCSRWVCGETAKDERRQMLADYHDGRFSMLVNVGVATEGFDEPGIEVVVMARPTKSRALYAQMAGRGTRPLAGIVDLYETAEDRRVAITESGKPWLEVLDFVGNSGRHKLITTADILGGRYADEVVARARRKAEKADGEAVDIDAELAKAEREMREDDERRRRAKVRIGAKYSAQSVDPFDVLAIKPWRERGWDKDRVPTEKQGAMLERCGIEPRGLTFTAARQLITTIIQRREQERCSFKQARLLARYGYPADMGFQQASETITRIAAAGWKRPDPLPQEAAT